MALGLTYVALYKNATRKGSHSLSLCKGTTSQLIIFLLIRVGPNTKKGYARLSFEDNA